MDDFEVNDLSGLTPEKLADFLSNLSEEELNELSGKLEKHLINLQNANSSFPETKRFLVSRGLTNVKDLDAKGLKELQEHLECVLLGLQVQNFKEPHS